MIDKQMADAKRLGLSVIFQLYPVTKYGPPLRPTQQREICRGLAVELVDKYHDQVIGVEIGVEPNNFTFWRPQFHPDGTQASAKQYFRWLSVCYDRLKEKHPDLLVFGLGLASSGEDDPYKKESSTSPTVFLQKFCEAYRASGRNKPVMDIADMHSYQGGDPGTQHPDSTTITIGDAKKLDELLKCLRPKPPVLWGESGYETAVPDSQMFRYSPDSSQKAATVDESTQGRYYAESIRMAFCDPNSIGFIQFLLVDEPDLGGWQSGLVYATDSPNQRLNSGRNANAYRHKQSWPIVRGALTAVNAGTVNCG